MRLIEFPAERDLFGGEAPARPECELLDQVTSKLGVLPGPFMMGDQDKIQRPVSAALPHVRNRLSRAIVQQVDRKSQGLVVALHRILGCSVSERLLGPSVVFLS